MGVNEQMRGRRCTSRHLFERYYRPRTHQMVAAAVGDEHGKGLWLAVAGAPPVTWEATRRVLDRLPHKFF